MREDIKIYLRLIAYIRPYWRVVLVSILAMTASASLEPVFPALMQPLIDKSLIQQNSASLWQVPVFIVLVFVLKGLADYTAQVAGQTIAQKTISTLRSKIFLHQLNLPVARHREEDPGRMLSRITYDTTMVGEAVSTVWLTVIRDTMVLVGLLAFLFYTAWQLTLLIFFIGPVLAYTIRRINGRLRKSSEQVQHWMGRITGVIEEALLGLREIKIFTAQPLAAKRFDAINQILRQEQMRVVRVQAINVPLVQILAACSVALVIYAASKLSNKNLLSPGEFVAFITAMSMIFEPIRRLTNVNAALQRGIVAARSIFGILDEPSECTNTNEQIVVNTRGHSNPAASTEISKYERWGISLDCVSYKYPNTNAWVLQNFSLEIEPQECVALIGRSGSGKSTIFNLICGFDRPTEGKIFIGPYKMGDFELSSIRENIALVSQSTLLFDLTVAENLRIGNKDASDRQIYEALEASNSIDFVSSLPQGIDTPLGALGLSLSGGQRQRLAIARAILKDAPIILLDEATSALDDQSEIETLASLAPVARKKTLIIITHNPKNLPKSTRVVNL